VTQPMTDETKQAIKEWREIAPKQRKDKKSRGILAPAISVL